MMQTFSSAKLVLMYYTLVPLVGFLYSHGSEIVDDATAHVPRTLVTCSLVAFLIRFVTCLCV